MINPPCAHSSGLEPGCASCWEGTALRASAALDAARADAAKLAEAALAYIDGAPMSEDERVRRLIALEEALAALAEQETP